MNSHVFPPFLVIAYALIAQLPQFFIHELVFNRDQGKDIFVQIIILQRIRKDPTICAICYTMIKRFVFRRGESNEKNVR